MIALMLIIFLDCLDQFIFVKIQNLIFCFKINNRMMTVNQQHRTSKRFSQYLTTLIGSPSTKVESQSLQNSKKVTPMNSTMKASFEDTQISPNETRIISQQPKYRQEIEQWKTVNYSKRLSSQLQAKQEYMVGMSTKKMSLPNIFSQNSRKSLNPFPIHSILSSPKRKTTIINPSRDISLFSSQPKKKKEETVKVDLKQLIENTKLRKCKERQQSVHALQEYLQKNNKLLVLPSASVEKTYEFSEALDIDRRPLFREKSTKEEREEIKQRILRSFYYLRITDPLVGEPEKD